MRILYSSLNMKFSKKKIKRKYRRQNISNAERLKDYNELQKGDYVVHQIHGIGQYLESKRLKSKGFTEIM